MLPARRLALLLVASFPPACGTGSSVGVPLPPAPDPGAEEPELVARHTALVDACRATPADPAPRRELARLLEANGRFGPARLAWETLTLLEPADERAWAGLSRTRSEEGDVPGALEALDRSLALAPDHAPSHWRRGLLLLDLDRLDEAGAAFERASRLAPDDPSGGIGQARVALSAGRPEEALRRLEELCVRHPADGYARHLLGRALLEAGRPEGAGELVGADPERTRAFRVDAWRAELEPYVVGHRAVLRAARAALRGGDVEGAIRTLEPLVRSQPELPAVQALAVEAFLQGGRPQRAHELLDRAEALGGPHYRIDVNRAVCFRTQGQEGRALEALERAVAANPAYAPAHLFRGELLAEAGMWPQARASLARAVELGEQGLEAHLLLADACRAMGDFEALREACEQAARLHPDSAEAWARLAASEYDTGREAEAERALVRLAELDPDHEVIPILEERLGRSVRTPR